MFYPPPRPPFKEKQTKPILKNNNNKTTARETFCWNVQKYEMVKLC